MCKPIIQLFMAVAFVSVLLGGQASAAENSGQLRGTTVSAQIGWTAGITVVPVGVGTVLTSYGFAGPSTNFAGGFFYALIGATGIGVMTVAATIPTSVTNLVARGDIEKTYLPGPLIGSVLGGIAGIYGARALSDNLWRTPRLDWKQQRWRTGFVIGLPITVGLTAGGVVGYVLEHRLRGNQAVDAESTAARRRTVEPVLGIPARADDSGWTLGASVRF